MNLTNDITNFEYLLGILEEEDINKIIEKYGGDENTKKFFTKDHLKLFMYAEIKQIESLRDMESAVENDQNIQKHVHDVSYAAISRNDSERNAQIFVEIFRLVVSKLMQLYGKVQITREFGNIKVLDSSTVTVALSLFPWAKYKQGIGGIKFHTLFDLEHSCPEDIKLTEAEVHDVKLLNEMVNEPGITYLYDRAYNDYENFDRQTFNGIYFVTRLKSNAIITVLEEKDVPEGSKVLEDKIVTLGQGSTLMETNVRIVLVEDERKGERFYIVTNRFDLTPDEISQLYRLRWTIELFFKFIKGHLTVKHFYGNSYNAIKIQLFIVMTVYCLLMIVKLTYNFTGSLLEILRAIKHNIWGRFKDLIKLFVKKVVPRGKRTKFDWKAEYLSITQIFNVKDEFINCNTS